MRRILVSSTVAVSLIAAAAAYAAVVNSYTAVGKITPGKAGTAAKPVPVGITLDYTAKGNGTNRTAVITDIKNTFYGLQSNGKLFKTCTAAQINLPTVLSNSVCPSGSLVGSGNLTARLGPTPDPTNPGAPCAKNIDIYNAGQGKLTFYLFGPPANCAGVGFLSAFAATIKVAHGVLTIDAPVPSSIGHAIPGLDGALETEHIVYNKSTKGKHGFMESVGCLKGKRAYSTVFSTATQTVSVAHTLTCSK